MTPDPDVTPVGFAATEGAGALVERRRNPLWLLLSLLLAANALLGLGWFVKEQAANAPGRDEAVAEGRVAALDARETPVVRFHGDGDYTVWLTLGEIRLSNRRETVVAATNCTAAFANGESARFRGARQGSAVTIGSRSTVGTFRAPEGLVELRCRQLPFGRVGRRGVLREERAFFVAPGKPGVGWDLWIWMFAGLALLIPAGLALGRFTAGSVRRR